MKLCPHCGTPNSGTNKWCESCGYELFDEDVIESTSVQTTAEVHNVNDSALVGSMGKTRYTSGRATVEAGDTQKHISGFDLVGRVGEVSYDAAIGESGKSERGEVHGNLLGTVGETKYVKDGLTDAEACEHRDSKLLGSVGKTKYQSDCFNAEEPSKSTVRSANLIGNVGGIKFTPKVAENQHPEQKSESLSALWGQMGDTRYISKNDTRRAAITESDPVEPMFAKKTPWLIVIISSIILILIVLIIGLPRQTSSFLPSFENAISTRINHEITYGDDLPLFIQYKNAIIRNIKFSVTKINNRSLSAMVSFSYLDVHRLMDDYISGQTDAESFYRICIDAINHGRVVYKQDSIEMQFSGSIPNIEVEDNEAFLNVLSGGCLRDIQNLIQGEFIR